jgi:hypothetical protein
MNRTKENKLGNVLRNNSRALALILLLDFSFLNALSEVSSYGRLYVPSKYFLLTFANVASDVRVICEQWSSHGRYIWLLSGWGFPHAVSRLLPPAEMHSCKVSATVVRF